MDETGKKKYLLILFSWYTFLENILYVLINLCPFFIRNILYKLMFHSLGRPSYIDYWCYFRYPRRMTVGNNVKINRGCKFFNSFFHKDVKIVIGNNVAIAPYVTFYAAGHDYNYINLPDTAKSIIVGDNVWIGGRSIILPGVTIGEGSIIGAGAVVSKDIPAW